MRVLVTGASGWIGSALVPDLTAAGHEVVGLARSDEAAATISSLGAEVQHGSIDDPAALGAAAASVDGVVHLAFRHDLAFSGERAAAIAVDRRAIEALGDVLAGSDRPLVIASGVLGLAPGRLATELDAAEGESATGATGGEDRLANARYTVSLAARGIRSSVVRLPPTCHGEGDNGFMAMLARIARDSGVSGYVGDGSARWAATDRLDAARVFQLALERAPAGATLHAVAEEGIPGRAIAEVIGMKLDVPVRAIAPGEAEGHFGFLASLLAMDSPASSVRTRELLEWEPTHPGLLDDLRADHYYALR